MTRARRARTTAGRSKYQMRMPYPGTFTPENVVANFREIARWANELPIPSEDTFVPYYIDYAVEGEMEWTVNLIDILHTTYDMDLTPTGTWLVGASLNPDWSAVVDPVGVRANLNIGTAASGFHGATASIGNNTEAIRVVKDVDFITPEVTYEWVLPRVGVYNTLFLNDIKVIPINAADDDISVQASAVAWTITDPDAGPDLTGEFIPTSLSVWAYRLSDGYSIPRYIEDITPP